MWILDPVSIATSGYVAPTQAGDFCPQPLAIASHGYIVFEADARDRRDGDGGHGAVILDPITLEVRPKVSAKQIALAIIAIDEMYD